MPPSSRNLAEDGPDAKLMAVATCPDRPPTRGTVEVASPRSVVMVLSGGRKRRLSRSAWSVAPVVGTQEIRDL
jgi:hypothetical protein